MKTTFRDLFRTNPELRAEVLQGWKDGCGDSFCDTRAELRESVNALREGIYLDQCDEDEARAAAWSIGRDLRLARERERETPPDIGRELARYGFLLVGTGGGCTAYEFQGDGWRTLVTLPNDPIAPVTLWEPVTETTEDKDGTSCCREYPSLSAYLESPYAAFLAHTHAQQGGE